MRLKVKIALLCFMLSGPALYILGLMANPPFWYTNEAGCTLDTPDWRCRELEGYRQDDLLADRLGVPRYCASHWQAKLRTETCEAYFLMKEGRR